MEAIVGAFLIQASSRFAQKIFHSKKKRVLSYMLLRVRKLTEYANSLDEFACSAQYANSSTSLRTGTEYANSSTSFRTRTFYLERKRTLFIMRIRCYEYAYSSLFSETKTRTGRVCVLERRERKLVVKVCRTLELRAKPGETVAVERGKRRK